MNWQQTVLPSKFLLKRYEKSYLFRTPRSFGNYTFFHPSSLVKVDGEYCLITFNDNWLWHFAYKENDGTYTKHDVNIEKFLKIWPNETDYIHHIPEHLEPCKVEVLKELLDVD